MERDYTIQSISYEQCASYTLTYYANYAPLDCTPMTVAKPASTPASITITLGVAQKIRWDTFIITPTECDNRIEYYSIVRSIAPNIVDSTYTFDSTISSG